MLYKIIAIYVPTDDRRSISYICSRFLEEGLSFFDSDFIYV